MNRAEALAAIREFRDAHKVARMGHRRFAAAIPLMVKARRAALEAELKAHRARLKEEIPARRAALREQIRRLKAQHAEWLKRVRADLARHKRSVADTLRAYRASLKARKLLSAGKVEAARAAIADARRKAPPPSSKRSKGARKGQETKGETLDFARAAISGDPIAEYLLDQQAAAIMAQAKRSPKWAKGSAKARGHLVAELATQAASSEEGREAVIQARTKAAQEQDWDRLEREAAERAGVDVGQATGRTRSRKAKPKPVKPAASRSANPSLGSVRWHKPARRGDEWTGEALDPSGRILGRVTYMDHLFRWQPEVAGVPPADEKGLRDRKYADGHLRRLFLSKLVPF